jgi:hypothetical protein
MFVCLAQRFPSAVRKARCHEFVRGFALAAASSGSYLQSIRATRALELACDLLARDSLLFSALKCVERACWSNRWITRAAKEAAAYSFGAVAADLSGDSDRLTPEQRLWYVRVVASRVSEQIGAGHPPLSVSLRSDDAYVRRALVELAKSYDRADADVAAALFEHLPAASMRAAWSAASPCTVDRNSRETSYGTVEVEPIGTALFDGNVRFAASLVDFAASRCGRGGDGANLDRLVGLMTCVVAGCLVRGDPAESVRFAVGACATVAKGRADGGGGRDDDINSAKDASSLQDPPKMPKTSDEAIDEAGAAAAVARALEEAVRKAAKDVDTNRKLRGGAVSYAETAFAPSVSPSSRASALVVLLETMKRIAGAGAAERAAAASGCLLPDVVPINPRSPSAAAAEEALRRAVEFLPNGCAVARELARRAVSQNDGIALAVVSDRFFGERKKGDSATATATVTAMATATATATAARAARRDLDCAVARSTFVEACRRGNKDVVLYTAELLLPADHPDRDIQSPGPKRRGGGDGLADVDVDADADADAHESAQASARSAAAAGIEALVQRRLFATAASAIAAMPVAVRLDARKSAACLVAALRSASEAPPLARGMASHIALLAERLWGASGGRAFVDACRAIGASRKRDAAVAAGAFAACASPPFSAKSAEIAMVFLRGGLGLSTAAATAAASSSAKRRIDYHKSPAIAKRSTVSARRPAAQTDSARQAAKPPPRKLMRSATADAPRHAGIPELFAAASAKASAASDPAAAMATTTTEGGGEAPRLPPPPSSAKRSLASASRLPVSPPPRHSDPLAEIFSDDYARSDERDEDEDKGDDQRSSSSSSDSDSDSSSDSSSSSKDCDTPLFALPRSRYVAVYSDDEKSGSASSSSDDSDDSAEEQDDDCASSDFASDY